MGAIADTFIDSVIYWAPGQLDSSGAAVYDEGLLLNTVRVDGSVDKTIRDLLVDKKPSKTVWSLQALEVGGWVCDVSVFDAAPEEHRSYPQLIEGARQVLHVDHIASYDRSDIFWRAVA
jgi:hypothetical protein